eukprot:m.184818 g.184818  ORF g.184818 m.184818 type:complete len:269 (-) comp24710_c0_seq3:1455-2261(-)
MNNKRLTVLATLCHFIRNCKQVIATDADTSNVCFRLLDYCEVPYKFVVNSHRHNEGINATEVKSLEKLLKKIKKAEKFIVCCDSKKLAGKIYLELGKKGKLYTSDNKEELDINAEEQLIFSPKIVYGLDSNVNRKVFCAFRGHTISPSNMLQQINRERSIVDVTFYFETRRCTPPEFSDLQQCRDFIQQQNTQALKQFEIVCPSLNQMFLGILGEIEYKFDCYKTNVYAHFLDLLGRRGFVVHPLHAKNVKVKKERARGGQGVARREL